MIQAECRRRMWKGLQVEVAHGRGKIFFVCLFQVDIKKSEKFSNNEEVECALAFALVMLLWCCLLRECTDQGDNNQKREKFAVHFCSSSWFTFKRMSGWLITWSLWNGNPLGNWVGHKPNVLFRDNKAKLRNIQHHWIRVQSTLKLLM